MPARYRYVVAACLCALFAAECTSEAGKQPEITVVLSKDSSAIVLRGLDYAIAESLQQDSATAEEWGTVLFVCRQSRDEELIGTERPYPGAYTVVQGAVVFTPDSGFSKGSSYRAEVRIPSFYSNRDVSLKKNLPGSANVKEALFTFK